MIIIVDSKEHADKYVEAGLVDEFVEIKRPRGMTPEEWKAAWDANWEANWKKNEDDEVR